MQNQSLSALTKVRGTNSIYFEPDPHSWLARFFISVLLSSLSNSSDVVIILCASHIMMLFMLDKSKTCGMAKVNLHLLDAVLKRSDNILSSPRPTSLNRTSSALKDHGMCTSPAPSSYKYSEWLSAMPRVIVGITQSATRCA